MKCFTRPQVLVLVFVALLGCGKSAATSDVRKTGTAAEPPLRLAAADMAPETPADAAQAAMPPASIDGAAGMTRKIVYHADGNGSRAPHTEVLCRTLP